MQDVFALVPGAEIRALREESPNNLATLVYKAVEKLVKTVDSSCRTQREQQTGRYFKILNYFSQAYILKLGFKLLYFLKK